MAKPRARERHRNGMRCGGLLAASLILSSVISRAAPAAENLALAPGLSFTDDSSDSFPIAGDRLGDGDIGNGRPTLAFFGAANCWNTNREAERVVAVYPKFRDRVRFIIVDVNHPSPAQRALLQSYYQGTIPTLVIFAPDGRVVYAGAGETARTRGDTAPLERLIAGATGG